MGSAGPVCVIGGGAVGLATALALTERGIRDVTVLEAEHLAAGSSSRSAGFVESQYVDPLDIELRARSMHAFRRLQRDEGLEIREIGYLRLAHTEDDLAAFVGSVMLQQELGIEHAEVLDAAAVRRLVPSLRTDDVAGGLWGPRDGRIDGPAYCRLLARLAEAAGAQVLVGRRVTGAERDGAAWRIATTGGTVEAAVVVLAAGGWVGPLGGLFGVAASVLPVRHQIVILRLEQPLPEPLPMVMDYVPHSGSRGLYVASHDEPAHALAGLHSEELVGQIVDPGAYVRDADEAYVAATRAELAARMPGLAIAGVDRAWAGVYPVSPDGLPLVGPAPGEPSVILAAGGGGSGIQLSPIIGELAADWVAFDEPRSLSDGARVAPDRGPWRVRKARPADVPAVMTLARAAWRATYGGLLAEATIEAFVERAYAEGAVARRIAGPAFLLAEDERGLAAFAEAIDGEGFTRLVAIYAEPGRRRQGAGGALLDALLARWPGRAVAADVLVGNEAGEGFYERRGFTPRERLEERLGDEPIVERRWWLDPGAAPASFRSATGRSPES